MSQQFIIYSPFIFAFFFNFVIVLITAIIAKKQKRSVVLWIFLSLFFGFIAIILLLVLPRMSGTQSGFTNKCKKCGVGLDPNVETCPKCFAIVKPSKKLENTLKAQGKKSENLKICPKCNNAISIDLKRCYYCGKEFK